MGGASPSFVRSLECSDPLRGVHPTELCSYVPPKIGPKPIRTWPQTTQTLLAVPRLFYFMFVLWFSVCLLLGFRRQLLGRLRVGLESSWAGISAQPTRNRRQTGLTSRVKHICDESNLWLLETCKFQLHVSLSWQLACCPLQFCIVGDMGR